MNPLTLLETLKLRDDYSPESLERQSKNLAANKELIQELAAEIRERDQQDYKRELQNE